MDAAVLDSKIDTSVAEMRTRIRAGREKAFLHFQTLKKLGGLGLPDDVRQLLGGAEDTIPPAGPGATPMRFTTRVASKY